MQIEELEILADKIVAEAHEEKNRLARLIRAYARILAAREPNQFPQMPLEYSDEDGHWDNSYPPKQAYKEFRGPRLYTVIECDRTDKATSGGFYHDSAYYTEDFGLFVAPDGSLWGSDESGTGEFGQFAAHPGACKVQIAIEYPELDIDDVPLDRLQKAERELRILAFPLVAARTQEAR